MQGHLFSVIRWGPAFKLTQYLHLDKESHDPWKACMDLCFKSACSIKSGLTVKVIHWLAALVNKLKISHKCSLFYNISQQETRIALDKKHCQQVVGDDPSLLLRASETSSVLYPLLGSPVHEILEQAQGGPPQKWWEMRASDKMGGLRKLGLFHTAVSLWTSSSW